MNKTITVLSDLDGSPTSLTLAASAITYVRGSKEWSESDAFPISGFPRENPHQLVLLCDAIWKHVSLLGTESENGCVILGSEISGTSFSALNRAGFLICESTGISDDFFDELFTQLASDTDALRVLSDKASSKYTQAPSPDSSVIPEPVETDMPGYFYIDLKEIQKCDPSLSTKKVLRPFFEGTPFVSLSMLCDHIPPWLELDLVRMGLQAVTEKIDLNTIRLTVTHKICGQ